MDYLVNNRGIDRGRITVVDGGCRESLTVELWICPTGAGAPTANKLSDCRSLSRMQGEAATAPTARPEGRVISNHARVSSKLMSANFPKRAMFS